MGRRRAEAWKSLEDQARKVELEERVEKLNQVLMGVPPAERGFAQKSVREDRGRDPASRMWPIGQG